jgi:hypothetical protein
VEEIAAVSLKVVRVLSAEEVTSDEAIGPYKKAAPPAPPAGATRPTPLEVGMIEIGVNVMLRVEIGQ